MRNRRGMGLAAWGMLGVVGCSGPGTAQGTLEGTSWRVEEVGGHGVLDGVRSTVEFPEAGRVAGQAACNRYSGAIARSGERIDSIGPLATTRMMCPPAVMDQEQRVLEALGRARRLAREGAYLTLYDEGGEALIRLTETAASGG